MQVFYHPLEQHYRPRHSFFNGRFMPYPDVPSRSAAILEALRGDGRFRVQEPPELAAEALHAVHGEGYVSVLEEVCRRLKAGEELFPGVIQRAPQLLAVQYARVKAGYYAVDTTTPLLPESFATALGAAATARVAALALLAGERTVYGLTRPPGHHAGREFYAGYCLVNNAALAAEILTTAGKVAVLDIDYHHGNGTQEIFYERGDVLYVSLHCRPEEAYPYTAGAASETGRGAGLGCNRNLPLPGGTDWAAYRPALETALETVSAHGPDFLVVSAGFDTLEGDPIGTFLLQGEDCARMGALIRQLGLPTLVVQEGGYLVPALGPAVLQFLTAVEAP